MATPTLAQIIAAITPLFEDKPTDPGTPPVVTPQPQPSPDLTLPAAFAGLRENMTPLYLSPTNQRITSRGLDDSSVWVIRFVTGELGTRPRFRGAESGSPTAQRVWAIVRRSDNKVIATGKGSTSPSIQCVVGPSSTPYLFSLQPHTEYALAVRADPRDSGTGNMYMDVSI